MHTLVHAHLRERTPGSGPGTRARLYFGLVFVLLQCGAPGAAAEETIRMRTSEGKVRAEFMLNPEHRCVLQDDAVVCTRVSR